MLHLNWNSLFLNGKYESNVKRSFCGLVRQNDGKDTSVYSLIKTSLRLYSRIATKSKANYYPNPINYDGAEVAIDLLVNLMYIYGKMYNNKNNS